MNEFICENMRKCLRAVTTEFISRSHALDSRLHERGIHHGESDVKLQVVEEFAGGDRQQADVDDASANTVETVQMPPESEDEDGILVFSERNCMNICMNVDGISDDYASLAEHEEIEPSQWRHRTQVAAPNLLITP